MRAKLIVFSSVLCALGWVYRESLPVCVPLYFVGGFLFSYAYNRLR